MTELFEKDSSEDNECLKERQLEKFFQVYNGFCLKSVLPLLKN